MITKYIDLDDNEIAVETWHDGDMHIWYKDYNNRTLVLRSYRCVNGYGVVLYVATTQIATTTSTALVEDLSTHLVNVFNLPEAALDMHAPRDWLWFPKEP